jgi:hypothetical protein
MYIMCASLESRLSTFCFQLMTNQGRIAVAIMTQPIESLPDWMAEAASSLPLLAWLLLIQTCAGFTCHVASECTYAE